MFRALSIALGVCSKGSCIPVALAASIYGVRAVRETTLAELLFDIDSVDDEMIVFVAVNDQVSLSTPALVLEFEESEAGVEGYRYLLEVELIKDVIDVWSEWRNGQVPSLEEKLNAVRHYAMDDAYQPAS